MSLIVVCCCYFLAVLFLLEHFNVIVCRSSPIRAEKTWKTLGCQFLWWKGIEGNLGCAVQKSMGCIIPYFRDQTKYKSYSVHFCRRSWRVGYPRCLERQSPRLSLFRILSNFKEGFSALYFCLLPFPQISFKFVLCLNAVVTSMVSLDICDIDILLHVPLYLDIRGE